jgi:mannose-6-phosphate isomerase-like protein (cupin superfamily)
MPDDQRPFVVGPGEGRFIDLGEFGMTLKADADETAGVVSVLEADEPPGFGPPIHVHHDSAEAFYVLEGEYIMYLEDREFVCPAGSFIFIPLGVRHGFRVGNVCESRCCCLDQLSGWRRPCSSVTPGMSDRP